MLLRIRPLLTFDDHSRSGFVATVTLLVQRDVSDERSLRSAAVWSATMVAWSPDPSAWMWFSRASLNIPAANCRLGGGSNPRTCRPCSTPGMAAAVVPLRSLNPYEPGPNGPGSGMLNWIDFGK